MKNIVFVAVDNVEAFVAWEGGMECGQYLVVEGGIMVRADEAEAWEDTVGLFEMAMAVAPY